MANWEGVSEFTAVVEQGGFTAAARQLETSTAHVSRQVSALEQRLASKLLYRTTRKVSVTEAGQLYYQHCRQVLDGLEEAELALSQLQAAPRGKLKLTAPTTYGESRIAPLLTEFMQQYPELEVQYRLTNQKVDLVEGGFDLAIRLGKLEDSSLMAKRLASRRVYLCAAPEYLQRCGTPQRLADLAQHNCLLGSLDYWRFQDQDGERNVRVSGSLVCNSGQTLLTAALQGLGIVQLPDNYVESHLAAGRLVSLLEQYRQTEEGVWALYPHNRQLSPKVRMLLDFLGDQLSD